LIQNQKQFLKSKAVFVLDEEKLVGILSVTDIAQAIAEERL